MATVLILVEGPTEERFVEDMLYAHMAQSGVYLTSKIVTTKHVNTGPDYKGGSVPYDKIRNQIMRLLGDSNASAVTTMFDYYGQLNDFPGRKDVRGKNCYDKVKKVEEAFGNDIDNSNFIPYLQLHEFEGLLFSSPEVIADNLIKPGKREHRELLKELQKIRNQVTTPEEINDNKKTCPSKRICKLAQKYQKINDGIPIAKKIGLEKIRKECPHFNEWLEKIEKLS